MDTLRPETPHNVVTFVKPRSTYLPIVELLLIEEELALADNAVWWFIDNPNFCDRDKERLKREYTSKGKSMFIWKYYAAARCYLGGYKALSACLHLRKAL